jgi:cytochrome c oxidase subunit 4
MSGFHDEYPSYETMALHDEATGKVVRKKLWRVFWIMLAVTIVELIIGFMAEDWALSKSLLKIIFIGLTIVKAAYIVMSFMHLGDEVKALKFAVLVPFTVFILYLVALVDLSEGTYSKEGRYHIDKTYFEKKTHHEAGAGEHH